MDLKGDGEMVRVETTVGRVIFNQLVPKGYRFINELLTKKSLRDIIGSILNKFGNAVTTQFLDDIMDLGFRMAFEGGLSFNLGMLLYQLKREPL